MPPAVDASLCQNCHQRPADTLLEYDEPVPLDYRKPSWSRMRQETSWSLTPAHGNVSVCRECAATYARSLSLRRTGRRFIIIGGILTAAAIVLPFVVLLLTMILGPNSPQPFLLFLLVLLLLEAVAIVLLLVGVGMVLAGRTAKRRATRFLANR